MRSRTMAYKFMVICPLLYVGAISARARLHVEPHTFVACTLKQQRAMAAYREPFIAAASFRGTRYRDVNRIRLREVADSWIQGAAEGRLQSLTPVHLDDFVRDGVKQQIYRANDLLVQLLVNIAQEEQAQPVQAAQDLVRAVKVAEVLKYSDPYAIAQSCIHQRTALQRLRAVSPKLHVNEKLWVRNELRELRSKQPSLEPMVRLLYRLYAESTEGDSNSTSLMTIKQLLRDQSTADRNSLTVLAALPRPNLRAHKTENPVIGLLRMSGIAQDNWIRRLDGEIALLGTTSVVGNPEEHRVVAAAP